MDSMGNVEPAVDVSEHDAIEYDHKETSEPDPEILGNDTFSLELRKDPTP